MHTAVQHNQINALEYLLENKANCSTVAYSKTPLHVGHYITFLFSVECLSLIMKCSSFQVAAENNFVECIHALFNNTSVLVDALNGIDEKETALHLASKHGYCDAAEALLQ